MEARVRCPWVGENELMVRYHDEEWGTPVRDDDRLFEMLSLEGAQAGLSWQTVLNKREGYRRGFHNFEIPRVAAMTEADVEALLLDPGVIRHRGKLNSVLTNARAAIRIQEELGSLSDFLWGFVGGQPLVRQLQGVGDYPTKTAESDAMSKGLLKRGFRFVGSTTCYAFMQACGMVDDHTVDCWRRTG
ncbi:MAG: DNA-3-methyladenine glycosylase I [Fimbriimonas sp.]